MRAGGSLVMTPRNDDPLTTLLRAYASWATRAEKERLAENHGMSLERLYNLVSRAEQERKKS